MPYKNEKEAISIRKSVKKYDSKFDIIKVRLPKGTMERIQKSGKSYAKFAEECILSELDRQNL